jgi:hypothetical protein
MGRTYSESNELIVREDRSANGTLRRDVIASKKTFTLAYDAIDNLELSKLDALYSYRDRVLHFELAYQNVNTLETETVLYNVLIKAFSKKRKLAVRGGLWEDVTVEFAEV